MIYCIIIDDEPKAIELLKLYCDRLNDISVQATFRDPVKALQYLDGPSVDLIFLDINMPKINGMSLAKIIGNKTNIVFTTAYAEYAVESYNMNAVDYLLKPISFDRFFKCIERFKQFMVSQKDMVDFISIKSGTTTYRIKPSEILYLEKDGNYCFYILDNKRIIARESIGESLSKLPSSFAQIHKSFIVNLDKVSSYGVDYLFVNDVELTISDSFRKEVLERLQS